MLAATAVTPLEGMPTRPVIWMVLAVFTVSETHCAELDGQAPMRGPVERESTARSGVTGMNSPAALVSGAVYQPLT